MVQRSDFGRRDRGGGMMSDNGFNYKRIKLNGRRDQGHSLWFVEKLLLTLLLKLINSERRRWYNCLHYRCTIL